jgi:hypothetical protein
MRGVHIGAAVDQQTDHVGALGLDAEVQDATPVSHARADVRTVLQAHHHKCLLAGLNGNVQGVGARLAPQGILEFRR